MLMEKIQNILSNSLLRNTIKGICVACFFMFLVTCIAALLASLMALNFLWLIVAVTSGMLSGASIGVFAYISEEF